MTKKATPTHQQLKIERERRLASAARETMRPSSPPPKISLSWLLKGLALTAVAAVVCAWLAVCLLFWQGQWQLVFHPAKEIRRTPASVGVPYDAVSFNYTEIGQAQLTGWWIPAESPVGGQTLTLLYLHGANGNLGDTVEELATLHKLGVNIFAIDYRDYGESKAEHPSEKRVYEDAAAALTYLKETRKIPERDIVAYGNGLGAVIAAETALHAPQLAGVIFEDPTTPARDLLAKDTRWHVVPVHTLFTARFDMTEKSKQLALPNLWLTEKAGEPYGYSAAPTGKALKKLHFPLSTDPDYGNEIRQFLDDL